jgi:hypothetical protein
MTCRIQRIEETPVWGGSRPGRAPKQEQGLQGVHKKRVEHCFSEEESIYNEIDFEHLTVVASAQEKRWH